MNFNITPLILYNLLIYTHFITRFKHSLMTWGDKFTDTEVDEAFAEFVIEDGQIDAAHLKSLMVAKKEGEEEA